MREWETYSAQFSRTLKLQTFASSSNHTGYISNFGLALYISDELVVDANKDEFVLMFDIVKLVLNLI